MTKFLHHICSVILIGIVLPIPHFYQNNTTRCNCKRNKKCSSQDGTCPDDECAGNYLGTNCQHADIKLTNDTIYNTIPPILLDGNDKTCKKQGRRKVTYTFQLRFPLHFIWVYVFAKTPIKRKPKLALYNTVEIRNLQFYILKLNEQSLLIKTHDPVMYDKLILSDLPEDLCSLDISLGRNLAISSTTNMEIRRIHNTIDGNDDYSLNSMLLETNGKWWRTQLLHPARVNLIQMVGVMSHCSDWKLQLQFNTIGSQIINLTVDSLLQTYQIQPGSFTKKTNIYTDVKSIISEVGFTLKSCASSSPKFVVTEVYIFGEFLCPDDWYGTLCEIYCPEGCRREICDPDWGCPEGCNQNWKGLWCDRTKLSTEPTTTTTTTATTTTSTSRTTTSIITRITPTATTMSTTSTTSTTTTITTRITPTPTSAVTNTTVATINIIKGRNKRCDLFKYGPICDYECNDNCAKEGLCDEDSGICDDGCKPGFIPPDCKTPCRKGTYSVNCTQTCANCAKKFYYGRSYL